MRPTALQWVMVCALALAVPGMHHLSAAGTHGPQGHAAMSVIDAPAHAQSGHCCGDGLVASPAYVTPGSRDLLKLCLAVLVAAATLTLAWLLRRRGGPAAARDPATALDTRRGVGPLRTRSDLLASLCVLRL